MTPSLSRGGGSKGGIESAPKDAEAHLRVQSATKEVEALVSKRKSMGEDDEGTSEEKSKLRHVPIQSMNFEETENYAWRLHQTRRFYHDIGHWWNASRRTTAWKWFLVVFIGAVVGAMGVLVRTLTTYLTDLKFQTILAIYENDMRAASYFALLGMSILYGLIAAGICVVEPAAAGSGLPEIKAYLNGINLNKVVRARIVIFKVIGMCFSCAAGLPLGKEGPMIHCGSVVGAAVSQGRTFFFGIDTSWTKFQDLRNDRSKRDFVTFGAAAGVAAAFSAPIGGVLFTLEEGASFWSATLTFRAFFCAMITELAINVILSSGPGEGSSGHLSYQGDTNPSMFPFGTFPHRQVVYFTYELPLFVCIGVLGGLAGALFNHINKDITLFRQKCINPWLHKRIAEVVVITGLFTTLAFAIPSMYNHCTPVPQRVGGSESENSIDANLQLIDELVRFQCPEGHFNQLASLWLSESNMAMQMLFHMPQGFFDTAALLGFVIPYFLFASIISGGLYPAGLFVPTLLSGAVLGRIFGHGLAQIAPNHFSSSGTYALLGAASVMGGMSRMTIAGTVIILEACGNSDYLLPLMLVFAAARYTGNAINQPMYDMQIDIKQLPFLEGHLGSLGMLNYHSISAVMSQPVKTVHEVNRVRRIYDLLKHTGHNGFPVVSEDGRLRGLILRKTLCTILKLKAFSRPILTKKVGTEGEGDSRFVESIVESSHFTTPSVRSPEVYKNTVQLTQSMIISHDALERSYPKYPQIEEIELNESDMAAWVDVRNYMDTAPYAFNESSSISRCYRLFRTMGLRHLIITDNQHHVTGIVTRHDITEHRLQHEWIANGDQIKSYYSAHGSDPAYVSEREALMDDTRGGGGEGGGGGGVSVSLDMDYIPPDEETSTRSEEERPSQFEMTFEESINRLETERKGQLLSPMNAGGLTLR